MPTSTRFVVAVHTLALLAISDGRPVRSEDIASSANTNPSVIRALLSRLSDVGLTTGQLGTGGGALLARAPADIRLLDVYQAVEDSEIFAMHRSPPDPNCPIGGNIQDTLRPSLDQARAALERELASVTIAAVAAGIAHRAKLTNMPAH
jgi:Rrf2 family protein